MNQKKSMVSQQLIFPHFLLHNAQCNAQCIFRFSANVKPLIDFVVPLIDVPLIFLVGRSANANPLIRYRSLEKFAKTISNECWLLQPLTIRKRAAADQRALYYFYCKAKSGLTIRSLPGLRNRSRSLSRQFWPESESESETIKFYRIRLRLCGRKITFHHVKFLPSEGKMPQSV